MKNFMIIVFRLPVAGTLGSEESQAGSMILNSLNWTFKIKKMFD